MPMEYPKLSEQPIITNPWGIIPETELESKIVNSEEFLRGASFGNQRKGHLEAKIGIHIRQILDYIDFQGWKKYRRDLRLIALLHDLGKYRVVYSRNGDVIGKGHSAHSVDIAKKFITEERIIQIIAVHDRYFHFMNNEIRSKFKKIIF